MARHSLLIIPTRSTRNGNAMRMENRLSLVHHSKACLKSAYTEIEPLSSLQCSMQLSCVAEGQSQIVWTLQNCVMPFINDCRLQKYSSISLWRFITGASYGKLTAAPHFRNKWNGTSNYPQGISGGLSRYIEADLCGNDCSNRYKRLLYLFPERPERHLQRTVLAQMPIPALIRDSFQVLYAWPVVTSMGLLSGKREVV